MHFPREIVIEEKKNAIKQAKKYQMGIIFQIDGSKLDTGNIGAVVTWKNKNLDEQKKMSIFLDKNKKILDVKLWVKAIALKTVEKKIRHHFRASITMFIDSREPFAIIQQFSFYINNLFIRNLIYQRALDIKKLDV